MQQVSIINSVGKTFGYLTVLRRNPDCRKSVMARCACGTVKSYQFWNLAGRTHRSTQSCGCMKMTLQWETKRRNGTT